MIGGSGSIEMVAHGKKDLPAHGQREQKRNSRRRLSAALPDRPIRERASISVSSLVLETRLF